MARRADLPNHLGMLIQHLDTLRRDTHRIVADRSTCQRVMRMFSHQGQGVQLVDSACLVIVVALCKKQRLPRRYPYASCRY